jgi:phosphatidylinositol alpha-1,6-mannosyltransferase
MRALIIASEFPPGPGGIGQQAHQLALSLHGRGWEIAVVSPQDYVTNEQALEFNARQPFRISPAPTGYARPWRALHRLRVAERMARTHHPEVLVGTGLSAVGLVATLSALRRLPAMAVAHGSEFGVGSKYRLGYKRLIYGHLTTVVAVSEFTRRVMRRAGICSRRLEVIPNAADHQRFRVLPESDGQAFRQRTGFAGGRLLLTVGQVSERKGQEVVIRALPEILNRFPDTHYLMIGLPTLQSELTRLARQLNVHHRIHFMGVVGDADLVRWLNCADLFVMTSRTTHTGDCEGFGIAVVEAALCGLPAVVSAQCGLVEAIEPNLTGLAVPENDELATAEAIVSLLADPPLRMAMGQAAQTRARCSRTWETCGAKYDALLRSLVAPN